MSPFSSFSFLYFFKNLLPRRNERSKRQNGDSPLSVIQTPAADFGRHLETRDAPFWSRDRGLFVEKSIGFDFDKPVRSDEAGYLHDRVRGSNVTEELAMHLGHRFPILDAG